MADITLKRPVKWHSTCQTHVGYVREINEDSVMSKPSASLWAVADGMGGYEAGNVASNMLVHSLEAIEPCQTLDEFVTKVEDCILDTNVRILEYSEIMLDNRMLGSTIVTLLIHGQIGACIWAGDSRLYLHRENNLQQISRDHSHVEELLKAGLITREEAENHPDANVITRAIGVGEEVFLDLAVFKVKMGDTYLLCSDGLYNMVDDEIIASRIANLSIEECAKMLIQDALDSGANDNISLVLVKGLPSKEDQH